VVEVEIGRDVALRLRLGQRVLHCAGQRGARSLTKLHQLGPRAAELDRRAEAKARPARLACHAIEHCANTLDRALAARQYLGMRSHFFLRIALHRRAVDTPFVAERVVQTLPADLHRIDEHLRRSAFETMLAKHRYRSLHGGIDIEFLGTSHDEEIMYWNDRSRCV